MWSLKARLWLAAALLASISAVATAQWFPLLLTVCLGSAVVYARLVFRPEGLLAGKRALDVDRIREGDTIALATEATNTGRSTSFLELRDRVPRQLKVESGRPSTVAALRPGGKCEMRAGLRAPLMGVYDMGPLEARLEDPYAHFFEERDVLAADQLIVMPTEAPMDKLDPAVTIFQSFQGEYQVNQPGDGFDFFGMRDYTPGDLYRSINWKASARYNKLIVNQFERTTSTEITFFIDGRGIAATGPEDRTAFVLASRTAATLLRTFFGRRDTPRVVIYGNGLHVVHPGPPERMVTESLETLAMWRPAGDEPFSHAIENTLATLIPGSPVVLFSSLLDDPTILESVALLLSHDIVVLVIAPPVKELPGTSLEEHQALLALRERTLDGLRGFDIAVIEPVHVDVDVRGEEPRPRGAASSAAPGRAQAHSRPGGRP